MKPLGLELVREANPVPTPDAIVDIQIRERTLHRVYSTPRPGPQPRRRPALLRRPAVNFAVAAGLLGVTAAAVAASGILAGTPYRPPSAVHVNLNPWIGVGVAVSGSAQLLAMAVPDTGGGLPWGMRVLQTTRGLGCVQVGRLHDGQLGVLGQDGVAANDGRFHELPSRLVQPWNCVTLDARGRAFINVLETGYASGPVLERSCDNVHCPATDQRTVAYGLLGPRAASLTYLNAGHKTTTSTVGAQGAYLIVLSAQRAAQHTGILSTGGSTGSSIYFPGLLEVTYKDGRSCRPSTPGQPPDHSCDSEGYLPPPAPRSVAQVSLHRTIRRYTRDGKTYADLLVTFRAPVAITNANTGYMLAAKFPAPCNGIGGVNLNRDVLRGNLVALDLPLPGTCPGTAIAHVALTGPTGADVLTGARSRTGPSVGDSLLPRAQSTSLGTFKFKLPRTNGASSTGGAPPRGQLPAWAR